MTAGPFGGRFDEALDAFYAAFGEEVVFLDLETTGCEQGQDRIVEIGALKFRGRRETGRFETLVNPGMELPRRIVHLTGLDPEALRAAPPFQDVRGPLLEFLGAAPVFAHNADFDRGFLAAALGGLANEFHDTCLFACLVLPDLVRFGLDHLVELFALPPRDRHTALNDARLTRDMFDRLVLEAARTMPLELAGTLVGATAPGEDSMRRFVGAVAACRARLPEPPPPPPPPAAPPEDFHVELSVRVAEASRAGRPVLVNAPRGARRPASLLAALAGSGRRFLCLVSDDDDLTRWRSAARAVAPDTLVLDRLFDHLCPRHLSLSLDEAAGRRALDAFGVYLRLLIERRPLLCRADVSPYMLHRNAAGARLVDRACEFRLDCAASECPQGGTCRARRIEEAVAAADLVVTPLANVYALHRVGRLDLLAGRAVALDAPERFEGFFEPVLDSLSFPACLEETRRLEELLRAEPGGGPPLAPLARAATKYLERLLDFLRAEAAESPWPIPLRRDTPKYEEYLCFLLDFHIHAANLSRAAQGEGAPRDPACREALARLARWNAVLADFFQGDGKLLRTVRVEGDDVRLELLRAEGGAPLGSLLRGRRGIPVVAVSGALGEEKIRDHVLETTGLSAAGNFDALDLAGEGPEFVVPREMPESSARAQALFDERFRELVLRIARETPGRLVVVFNSTARLKALGPALAADLEGVPGLLVLRQYHDGGKEKMLRAARGLGRVALIGSAGFYQVLDVEEGWADTVVVEKAPFPHVHNELVALRRSRLKARGYDDFADYMVPTMLLKMAAVSRRVAPGGALVVADGRLPAMHYYPLVLEAVSPSRVHDSIDAYLRRKGASA